MRIKNKISVLTPSLVIALVSFSLFLTACTMPTTTNNNSGPPFSVTYMNTTVNTTGSVPVDSTQYDSGATVTVLGNTGALSWPPFTWIGWNTLNNGGSLGGGGGTFYASGDTFTITSNVTLFGQWQ